VITEKQIEDRFVRMAEERGWWAVKLASPSTRGMPDRMVLTPGKHVVFIEFKRPGAKVYKLQGWVHDRLRRLGFTVFVCEDAQHAADQVEASIESEEYRYR